MLISQNKKLELNNLVVSEVIINNDVLVWGGCEMKDLWFIRPHTPFTAMK